MAVETSRKPIIARSSRLSAERRREWITAYLFIAPWLITTSVFMVGLLVYAFYTSLTNRGSPLEKEVAFIGFGNYLAALRNTEFLIALGNVFWYFVIVTTSQTIGAILLAVALNAPMKGQRLFRTMFYAPSVASSVVLSMIFLWLYIRTGFINYFLNTHVNWLADPRGLLQLALQPLGVDIGSRFLRGPSVTWTALMAMNIYSTIPTLMLMFLAALQDIPGHLYEAAAIDGAGKLRQFFSITLPLLRPTIVLVVVLGTIATFQVFDQVNIMTQGGPSQTTLVPTYLIYTKTLGTETRAQAGLAAAMAFILAAIIFIISYLQRRFIESGSEQV
jgi:multiple sugar transport system permease protein